MVFHAQSSPPCPCFGCTFRKKVLEHKSAQLLPAAALRTSQIGNKLKLTEGMTFHWNSEAALIAVSTLITHSDSFHCNYFKCIKLHQPKATSVPTEGSP